MYTNDAILLMIDALGVQQSTKVLTPTIANRHAYYDLSMFFEDALIVLTTVFDASTSRIFAYGDTICVYSHLSWGELEGDWPTLAKGFVKRSAEAVAQLTNTNLRLFFRAYLSTGDMFEIDFRSYQHLEAYQQNSDRIRMATSIGTALISAVELERRSIKSTGLFTTSQTAEILRIALVGGAEIQCSNGSDIVMVDISEYLGRKEYEGYIGRLKLLTADEPTDVETLENWSKTPEGQKMCQICGRVNAVEEERLLRQFRNAGRPYVRNLLKNSRATV